MVQIHYFAFSITNLQQIQNYASTCCILSSPELESMIKQSTLIEKEIYESE